MLSRPRSRTGNGSLLHMRSQSGEDEFAYRNFFSASIKHKRLAGNGTFVELGALDGLTFSNTHAFEKSFGWHGLLIEADPSNFAKLVSHRPSQILVHAAVCSNLSVVDYVTSGHPAVKGILQFMSPQFLRGWHRTYQLTKILCVPLEYVLNMFAIVHVDMLSLDVEGGELEVLKTIDFESHTFSVILVEAEGLDRQKEREVIAFLQSQKYTYYGNFVRSNWFFNPKYIRPIR
ncbi:hypothetical protein GUITHDRAFT_98750, partial [Guillardia theta CCMP2712]